MLRIVGLVALLLAIAGMWRLALGPAPSAFGGLPATAAGIDASAPVQQGPPPVRYLRVGQLDLADVSGLAAANGLLYLADARHGLQVYDLSNPSVPVRRGQIAAWRPSGVVVDGDTVLVAHEPGTVSLFDVSDPSAPLLSGTLRLGHPVKALAARAGIGALGDDRDLVAFDYRTPSAPRELGRVEIDYFGPLDIVLAGPLAYVGQHGTSRSTTTASISPAPRRCSRCGASMPAGRPGPRPSHARRRPHPARPHRPLHARRRPRRARSRRARRPRPPPRPATAAIGSCCPGSGRGPGRSGRRLRGLPSTGPRRLICLVNVRQERPR